MAANRITAGDFTRRVVRLLGGPLPGLPRRRRDRHIVLKAASLSLERRAACTQVEMDAALTRWLSGPGRRLEVDHVALRRCLVDDGYLVRDPGGTAYQVRPSGRGEFAFEPEVESVDVELALHAAAEDRERRKRDHAGRTIRGNS